MVHAAGRRLIPAPDPICILRKHRLIRTFFIQQQFGRFGCSGKWGTVTSHAMIAHRGWPVVLDTFANSSAERVPSECSQSRYIADIFHTDIYVASPDILPIYFTQTYFKTSKTCGSKSVNQKGLQNMTTKARIVFGRAEQKNLS